MVVANPEDVEYILKVLKNDSKYQGGGCGVGFKEKAFDFVDEKDKLVESIGSINCIEKTDQGKLRGYNTDGEGYAKGLEKLLEKHGEKIKGKKILMLGAGGTANAVAFALANRGAKIIISNRTIAYAQELADSVNNYFSFKGENAIIAVGEDSIPNEVSDTDIIVNVSSKGEAGKLEKYSALAKADGDAEKNLIEAEEVLEKIPKHCIITDVLLAANDTPMIASAKAKGFETQNGLPMVIYQAAKVFSIIYDLSLEEVEKVMEDSIYNQR
jgi:shikimate dehydrogenase